MKVYVLAFLFFATLHLSRAQSTHDILVGGGNDLIKTDIQRLLNRAQFGAEANYFVVRHFAAGAGVEFWTHRKSSFVVGVRWYANEKIFFRFRGLIGTNDASLGTGWSQPLTPVWRVEGIADYYFQGDFAIRAGISYVLRRK